MIARIRKHAEKRLNLSPLSPPEEFVPILRQFLKLEDEMLLRRHRAGDGGMKVAKARAHTFDLVLGKLFELAMTKTEAEHGTLDFPVCLVAIGGYGRGELSPHSDIDIQFLYPDSRKNGEAAHEEILQSLCNAFVYPLWDLGLKIGYSLRSPKGNLEEARKDRQTKTALLETRVIAGDDKVFTKFKKQYQRYYCKERPGQYLQSRLEDQAERRKRYGGTIYLQEPDVKNGVGGIRDYQNAIWMARVKLDITHPKDLVKHRYLRQRECRDFMQAYDFLLRVRNELHFLSRRPTDTLDLENQPVVAKNLGYEEEDIFARVERFMRDYYNTARTIFRVSSILESRLALRPQENSGLTFGEVLRAHRRERTKKIDGFILRGDEIHYEKASVFKEDPGRLIRIFRHCQQFRCRMNFELQTLIPESLNLITNQVLHSEAVNISFKTIFQQVGEVFPILMQMHELGVLGKFVPEFGKLDCLVQHEFYHRYTADVHTLNTIRQLDRIFAKKDPGAEKYLKALRETGAPWLLYLVLLLHDIGKSKGNKGHAEVGADMALQILDRMRVEDKFYPIITSIIENHLEMARIWQRYDLDDPSTANAFAERVENPTNLRYLYVHTVCDARGTAASLWNSYKDTLHTQLYKSTLFQLTEKQSLSHQAMDHKKKYFQEIISRPQEALTREEIEAHFNLLPERYFRNTDSKEITLHMGMIHQLLDHITNDRDEDTLRPVIDWYDDIDRSMTVVDVVTWDRAGLFYKMAGAFSAAGLNILTAKAISREDHIAIDTFHVVEQGGGVVQDPKAFEIFADTLNKSLIEGIDEFDEKISKKQKALTAATKYRKNDNLRAPVPCKVEVYYELSLNRTIIEIQANDELGLLFQVAREIFKYGYDITFARIATERSAAVDTFYIEPIDSKKKQASDELNALKESLESIVAPCDIPTPTESLAHTPK
ncbi:MAG: [protein-PII] uridylyltransferase [Opitutales bacterium]|nr:[protein-PII] uridylyltransferase [Opitutales bacterium]